MKAEIIAVGTELLLGDVVNTNAAEIARMLAELGIGVYYQTVVGDNPERLRAAVTTAAARVDLVVLCGGLGPTEDDLTRETVAHVLNRPLLLDEAWAAHLQQLFAQRRWGRPGRAEPCDTAGVDPGRQRPREDTPFPKNNLRQAMVPEGGTLLPNDRGTAPGIYLTDNGTTFVLLPGPPGEMRALMRQQVLPLLAGSLSDNGGEAVLMSRVLRVIGLGESRAAELLADILDRQTNPTIAPLAHSGEMTFRITARAENGEAATAMINRVADEIYAVLGTAIYGEDDETLESVVGALLIEKNLTAATAESCTGGLTAHRLTNVPGSSRYFRGAVVAYDNAVKERQLQVDPDLIESCGAVSEEVARAMAENVTRLLDSDVGVGITGIAGPDGGTEEKPVGLTWIAVAAPRAGAGGSGRTVSRRYQFPGDRFDVKRRAAHAALALLREVLMNAVQEAG